MPCLRGLALGILRPAAAGEAAVAAALPALTALTSLQCGCGQSYGELVSVWQQLDVARELRRCTALRELAPSCHTATSDWVSALAASVLACTRLVCFDLTHNRYGRYARASPSPLFQALARSRVQRVDCTWAMPTRA